MDTNLIERKTEILKVHINELKQSQSYEQLLFYLKHITSVIIDDINKEEIFQTKIEYQLFIKQMIDKGIYNSTIDK
tara:strand:+ start:104 stop:331 length:228 start_codon:yes stop_codon:yes gene_type:complete